MPTSEDDCLDALREAAAELGTSPTKAEYEDLGMTPSSGTIQRVVGGWNEAKKRAGLETNPSRGSRVGPKPDDMDLPTGTTWEDLTVDQRWHYRNVERNTRQTLERRARLREWINDRKRQTGCRECDERDPACLDFHHPETATKEMSVSSMITHGHGRDRLDDEIANCEVLCANCHRRHHLEAPDGIDSTDRAQDSRATTVEATNRNRSDLRRWLYGEKTAVGGCSECEEMDPRCLVFHHEDDKEATVARMLSNRRPKTAIASEIEQCTVLCANCHRQRHFEPPRGD